MCSRITIVLSKLTNNMVKEKKKTGQIAEAVEEKRVCTDDLNTTDGGNMPPTCTETDDVSVKEQPLTALTDNDIAPQPTATDTTAERAAETIEGGSHDTTAEKTAEANEGENGDTTAEQKAETETETSDATADKNEPSLPCYKAMFNKWADNKGLTDNERQEMDRLLTALVDEIGSGHWSESTLQHLAHAVNYERDLLKAARDGEIKGRNMKIEEYLIERRNANEIRQLGCSSATSKKTPPASVIGGLSAADRQSIWERGHEKRVSHH